MPDDPRMSAFSATRILRRFLRRTSSRTAYLDRVAPRLVSAKLLTLAFTRGPLIEPAPGSNCPGCVWGPGWSALASRFLAFCAAFAFARWRALALVMSCSSFQFALGNFDDSIRRSVKSFCTYPAAATTRIYRATSAHTITASFVLTRGPDTPLA